jgi:hypothetical protein
MSKFNKAYDAWKEAEEEENRVFQRGGYASEQERREAEAAADDAYSAVADVVYGHGGPRPNSGGARPNSGPLPSRVVLHPFTHREKGPTISMVSLAIERCNDCGAIGWEIEFPEKLYVPALSDSHGDGFCGPQPESIEGQELQHKPGCQTAARK